jgi:transcriptional regulator with XRE-family HTH domain
LRAIRLARNLSLAEVSRQTDISRSFLSLVENGQNEITIGRLMRLMRCYGIHVSDFMSQLEGQQRDVIRREDRRTIPSPDEHLAMHLLATDESRSMLPMIVEFAPGGGFVEPGHHPGEEFVHVIDGEVVLQLEGDAEPIVLRSGDTAWFPGEQGHTLTNGVDAVTRIIAVVSPPIL